MRRNAHFILWLTFWLGVGLLCAMLTGCVSTTRQAKAGVPAPAPWPKLNLAWEHDGNCDGFRLYHSTNLLEPATLTLLVDNIPSTNRTVRFQSQQMGMMGLKAFRLDGTNKVESQWGTK